MELSLGRSERRWDKLEKWLDRGCWKERQETRRKGQPWAVGLEELLGAGYKAGQGDGCSAGVAL